MASSNFANFILFLSLSVLFVNIVLVNSTSRHALINNQKGFKVSLKHVDSGGNFTKFERLQRAMARGKSRLQRLNLMANNLVATTTKDDSDIVKSTIHAGNGEFLMQISIGSPSETYNAIMDTGSDLIWTQCKPCKECFDQSTPIFDPSKSSTFSKIPCSNKLCEALPMSSCGDSNCEYMYTYGDYSSSEGFLASETFTFGKNSIPKVAFGCGNDNQGSGFSQGAGLVGLGRGPLSLVSQLQMPKFSYCLTSINDDANSKISSTLLMGTISNDDYSNIITTPLVKNPSQPSFYYLSLEGISVGDTRLPIKKSTFSLNQDGTGGVIIDSGTTITYLEESAFKLLKKEFSSQVNLPVDDSSSTGLDLCFTLPSNTNNIEVPKLVFHFEGADLDLPADNYMIADSSMGVACLAMGGSTGMSIFGNVQQQNMLVIHDLNKETLSFVPTQCDKL
ncbi:PREDICTED: aspartic proteinase nepenthesin-1 [Nicotiana attenuata]|uniref:Aspartyl protease family protein 2 n=1 Tax=Nicotiana attenuata TaxID=49451 RepID=A0A1J6IRZ5_NICAT|nr:PREDICTED: aspartic proteinase nepenthesin-1 [Nicotiana attenuata]OIT03336.1 aspartyl protease family protein 2 [Nicotiana attenuata]